VDGHKEVFDLSNDLAAYVETTLNDIHTLMYEKAKAYLEANIHSVSSYDEFKSVLENEGGYIRASWCGEESCEVQIKEETGATSRCIRVDETPEETCVCCGKKAKHVVYFAKAY